jgi:hypothetical protein
VQFLRPTGVPRQPKTGDNARERMSGCRMERPRCGGARGAAVHAWLIVVTERSAHRVEQGLLGSRRSRLWGTCLWKTSRHPPVPVSGASFSGSSARRSRCLRLGTAPVGSAAPAETLRPAPLRDLIGPVEAQHRRRAQPAGSRFRSGLDSHRSRCAGCRIRSRPSGAYATAPAPAASCACTGVLALGAAEGWAARRRRAGGCWPRAIVPMQARDLLAPTHIPPRWSPEPQQRHLADPLAAARRGVRKRRCCWMLSLALRAARPAVTSPSRAAAVSLSRAALQSRCRGSTSSRRRPQRSAGPPPPCWSWRRAPVAGAAGGVAARARCSCTSAQRACTALTLPLQRCSVAGAEVRWVHSCGDGARKMHRSSSSIAAMRARRMLGAESSAKCSRVGGMRQRQRRQDSSTRRDADAAAARSERQGRETRARRTRPASAPHARTASARRLHAPRRACGRRRRAAGAAAAGAPCSSLRRRARQRIEHPLPRAAAAAAVRLSRASAGGSFRPSGTLPDAASALARPAPCAPLAHLVSPRLHPSHHSPLAPLHAQPHVSLTLAGSRRARALLHAAPAHTRAPASRASSPLAAASHRLPAVASSLHLRCCRRIASACAAPGSRRSNRSVSERAAPPDARVSARTQSSSARSRSRSRSASAARVDSAARPRSRVATSAHAATAAPSKLVCARRTLLCC